MPSDQVESPPSSIDTSHVPPSQIVVPPVAPAPAAQDPPPPAPSKFSFPTLIASVVLSIAGGALGAWAYDRYALKPKAESPPPKAEANTPAPFPESAGTVLAGDVETLQKRVVRIEEGLAAIPKDQPLADVAVLKERVAAVEKAIGQEGADKKLGAIEARVEKADKGLGDLKSEIESLRQALDADHTAIMALRQPPPDLNAVRTAAKAAVEDINVDGEALSEGAQLLEKKQYADARDLFRKMQENHPTDARVWYFSALATGFATGDWTGQAERLVEKGIEREKAGTPDKAAIDATFSNLSKQAGKDWLAAYRLRAK